MERESMQVKLESLPDLLAEVGIYPDITLHVIIPLLATNCQNPTCKKLLEEEEVAHLEEIRTETRLCSSCLFQCQFGDLEDEDEYHCQWFGLLSEFDDDGFCPNHSKKMGPLYCRQCFAFVFEGDDPNEWADAQAEHGLRDMRCLQCFLASQPKIEYQTRQRVNLLSPQSQEGARPDPGATS